MRAKQLTCFNQMKTPILGMIENMSTHICSNCGHEEHLFGHGGVTAEAKKGWRAFVGGNPTASGYPAGGRRRRADCGVQTWTAHRQQCFVIWRVIWWPEGWHEGWHD